MWHTRRRFGEVHVQSGQRGTRGGADLLLMPSRRVSSVLKGIANKVNKQANKSHRMGLAMYGLLLLLDKR